MYSMRMTHKTGTYTGVDYGKVDWPDSMPDKPKNFNMKLIERTDFVEAKLPRKKFNVGVCFEVVEHVEPFHAYQILKRLRQSLRSTGTAFISTPVYDPRVGAAGNHVNEMSFEAMYAMLILAGFAVVGKWGTFASQRDYKDELSSFTGVRGVFDALSAYYDSNTLACIFAPLFPQQSRNVLWRVKAIGDCGDVFHGEAIRNLRRKVHSSSTKWTKEFSKIIRDVSCS